MKKIKIKDVFQKSQSLKCSSIDSDAALLNHNMVVDPGTAALIIAGAQLLSALFLKKDGSDVGKWIDQISDQLAKTNALLTTILDVLEDLKVYMDLKFQQDAEADVLSYCSVYTSNFKHYMANPKSPNNVAAMGLLLLSVQKATRKVMNYGYAGSFSVFFGLRVETDLLYLLDYNKGSKTDTFKLYSDYFDNCLNPNIVGSVANRIPIVQAEMAPLLQKYQKTPPFWDPPGYYRGPLKIGNQTYFTKFRENFGMVFTGTVDTDIDVALRYDQQYQDSSLDDDRYYRSRADAFNAANGSMRSSYLPIVHADVVRCKMLTDSKQSLDNALWGCQQFKASASELKAKAS